jgi:hypothetical protein
MNVTSTLTTGKRKYVYARHGIINLHRGDQSTCCQYPQHTGPIRADDYGLHSTWYQNWKWLDLKQIYRHDESLWTAKISTLKMNVHKRQRDYRRYRRRMQRQSQKLLNKKRTLSCRSLLESNRNNFTFGICGQRTKCSVRGELKFIQNVLEKI